MGITYSPEQERIFEAKAGGFIVVANAGTGKTTSTAELILRRYLDEERRMFGDSTGHVSGPDQMKLLNQFLCVTFTVKAAAELDAKLKKGFAELGIPLPKTARGDEYRIARTLDSFVQAWLRKSAVFRAWMATDPDTEARINEVIGLLPEISQALLGSSRNACHAFSIRWPWLPGDDVATVLLDLIIRHHKGLDLPGIDVNTWAADFNDYLFDLNPTDGGGFENTFWTDRTRLWKEQEHKVKDLEHALKQGASMPDEEKNRALASVQQWQHLDAARAEFISVYELARARGFHPTYAPERLISRPIENQLAACEHIASYKLFLAIAEHWHRVKTHFLVREFGDQTTALVRACETHPELMERDREYPYTIRRKYVFWDEVQDNSDFQHRILRLFFGRGVPFLSMAIGDPKQQIYCWRGASPRGFLEMIERTRQRDASKIIGLTCSFRSARKIVALGNEIIQTLPTYRDKVQPSTTIYDEDGTIEVTPPFASLDEEGEWVFSKIQRLLAHTSDSIMVVSRTDISDHPLWVRHLRNHPETRKRISCLTIHKSKGLEADVVFVLGMVAGKIPDYRSNSDEEVNLFYVACTRAKKHLILCGLVARRELNDAGKIEDKVVGPSLYFSKIPSLRVLCTAAQWPDTLLKQGVDAQNQLLAAHLSKIDKRRGALIRERMQMFPTVDVPGEHCEDINDYGVTAADPGLKEMQRQHFAPSSAGAGGGRPKGVSDRLRARVLSKLIQGHRMRGALPRLQSDEFNLALRFRWIEKREGSKAWTITQSLLTQASIATAATADAKATD